MTYRGEVVAEMGPPGQVQADRSLPRGLAELARRGLVTLGQKDSYVHRRPRGVMTPKEVAALLNEIRGPK